MLMCEFEFVLRKDANEVKFAKCLHVRQAVTRDEWQMPYESAPLPELRVNFT